MSRASLQSICLAAVFALLSACGGGDDGPSGSKLFAGDSFNQAIGSLINANPGPGALLVDRIIFGPSTQLSSSINGFALDAANDRLYVANGIAGVLVFDGASGADGDVPPSRVIPVSANSLFLDTVNDRLYVADTSSVVRVFDSASTTITSIPSRSITLSTGGSVFGVAVDVSKNILYALVSQSSAPIYSVRVIDGANPLDGSVAPTRTIELSSQITNCGLFLDAASDRLYIGTAAAHVLVYEDASTRDIPSTTPPDKDINFTFGGETKVAVDTVNDRLYAVSGPWGYILSNVSTAVGAVGAKQLIAPNGGNLTAVAVRP